VFLAFDIRTANVTVGLFDEKIGQILGEYATILMGLNSFFNVF
jgi:hypothetical protein